MNASDAKKITELQNQGYLVMVKDPYGDSFGERYRVYQRAGSSQLKTVVINEDGRAIGAQG